MEETPAVGPARPAPPPGGAGGGSKCAMRRDARRPPLCESTLRFVSSVSSVDDAGNLLISFYVVWKTSKFLKFLETKVDQKSIKKSTQNGSGGLQEASKRSPGAPREGPRRLPEASWKPDGRGHSKMTASRPETRAPRKLFGPILGPKMDPKIDAKINQNFDGFRD